MRFSAPVFCGSDCDFYCGLIQGACTGSLAQYKSVSDCMTQCAKLAVGNYTTGSGPITGPMANTLQCRMYHASVAAQPTNAGTHCPHAGFKSTVETCGTKSAASGLSASLLLVAILAFFNLF